MTHQYSYKKEIIIHIYSYLLVQIKTHLFTFITPL